MKSLISAGILSTFVFSTNVYALDISFGTGEDKDCNIARAFAINNAIDHHAEKEFEVIKRQTCRETNSTGVSCEFIKRTEVESNGVLKKVLNERVRKNKHTCLVDVKIEIEPSRILRGDIINAKEIAIDGERYNFDIITKEPLYVYLFNAYQNTIKLMYPYDNSSNLLHGSLSLPDGNWWQADLPKGVNQSEETLMAVFSKEKISFGKHMDKDEIYRQIASMPMYSRRVVYHNFVIKRRK
jgi:hypothetical protein